MPPFGGVRESFAVSLQCARIFWCLFAKCANILLYLCKAREYSAAPRPRCSAHGAGTWLGRVWVSSFEASFLEASFLGLKLKGEPATLEGVGGGPEGLKLKGAPARGLRGAPARLKLLTWRVVLFGRSPVLFDRSPAVFWDSTDLLGIPVGGSGSFGPRGWLGKPSAGQFSCNLGA